MMNLLLGFAMLWEALLLGFLVAAVLKQPKRMKPRWLVGGHLVLFVVMICAFMFARNDPMTQPLLAPFFIIAPLAGLQAVYRLYKYWDAKFWDPTAPDFVGWIRK